MNERVDPNMRLPAEDLAAITKHGIVRDFRARTMLVTEGEETNALTSSSRAACAPSWPTPMAARWCSR